MTSKLVRNRPRLPVRFVSTIPAFAAFTLAAAAYQACSVYDRSLLLPAPTIDAGPADPCNHALPPPRPTDDDGGAASVADAAPTNAGRYVVALASIDIGLDGDPGSPLPPLGYDLDGVCTCTGQDGTQPGPGSESCIPRNGGKVVCDDDRGRDHAGLQVFRQIAQVSAITNATLTADLQAGRYSLLIEVRDYNGTPNDSSVRVAVYLSNGLSGFEDGGTPVPKNDGSDRWTVDPRWVNGGNALIGHDCGLDASCAPNNTTSVAYVTNGVLVASIDALNISLGNQSSILAGTLALTGSKVSGTLTPVTLADGSTGFRVDDGMVAGRWATGKLLSNLASIHDPLNPGGFVCGDSLSYVTLKGIVCGLADISSVAGPGFDNAGAPCDALSTGFGFKAIPAQLGEVAGTAPAAVGCTTNGVPFQDDCP